MDRAELLKVASLEQLNNRMRKIQQQEVRDMEADLTEDDVEDTEMSDGELRNGSEGEDLMTDEEQRVDSVAAYAGHSKRNLERVKKALMRIHIDLVRQGVKELIDQCDTFVGSPGVELHSKW